MNIPYEPIRVEYDGCRVYDLYDVEMFGSPEIYGVDNFIVLDNFEVSRPMVLDWKASMERVMKPIHRYDAVKRFEYLVRKLLGGCRGKIPDEVLRRVRVEVDTDPKKVWNSVRGILKSMKMKKYYDRIPCILDAIGYQKRILWKSGVDELVLDFTAINNYYHRMNFGDRVYFPNFRFFALKLMEYRGVVLEYDIPLLRTERKISEFEAMWQVLSRVLY